LVQRTLDHNKKGYAIMWVLGNHANGGLSCNISAYERTLMRLYRKEILLFMSPKHLSYYSFEHDETQREDQEGFAFNYTCKRRGWFVETNELLNPPFSFQIFKSTFRSAEDWRLYYSMKKKGNNAQEIEKSVPAQVLTLARLAGK
jgi:hypothetical protein